MSICFDGVCGCRCGADSLEFDRIVQAETRLQYRLHDLCHMNIGNLLADQHFLDPSLAKSEGLYFIWEKNGWCDTHGLFHMKCLYVGKGKLYARLYDHWKNKGFSNHYDSIIYTTHCEMPNRHAKYVEQLVLDLFEIPLNTAESRGTLPLCAHFTQLEVD